MTITYSTFYGTKGGLPEKKSITKPDLVGQQVFIRTTHSGVCGTDLHAMHAGGIGLGHEGAGIVEAVGPDVTTHKVGDRVAWPYVYGSCGSCLSCLSGFIAMCTSPLGPGGRRQYLESDFDQGSFSSGAIWDARYVYHIPDDMASEDAAPLMCGGWTVWNCLIGYNLRPTDHVGVIGIGGLGHLALQLASKMGCEVTAFSGTEGKKEEAMTLGAGNFVVTSGKKELVVKRPVNVLLVCTNHHIEDWMLYYPILAPLASIFPLEIPADQNSVLSVPHLPFLTKGINIHYSTNGPHIAYDQLLAFAALHKIKPILERFPMTAEGIKEAFERLESGKLRYRGILVV